MPEYNVHHGVNKQFYERVGDAFGSIESDKNNWRHPINDPRDLLPLGAMAAQASHGLAQSTAEHPVVRMLADIHRGGRSTWCWMGQLIVKLRKASMGRCRRGAPNSQRVRRTEYWGVS